MALFNEKHNTKKTESNSALFDEANIKKQRKRKKNMKLKIKPTFAEISPIVDISANGYFEMKDDEGYFEMVQLTSKDVYSLKDSDKDKDIYTLAYFFQWYLHDIKIIPLNFPVDTSNQQAHILKKIETTTKDEYLYFLKQKLQELQFIEKERTNREYYMFIYADDEHTLHSRINQVSQLLQTVLPVISLTDEKKINILYKLFNLNTKNKSS